MANIINILIGENRKKAFRPKQHKELTTEWYERFKEWGEGMFYANIQSRENNTVAKLISRVSGGLTHSIAILYAENLKDYFTDDEWITILCSWNNYYGGSKVLDETVKVLVLVSADENGMNCFDFSAYQKRQLSIREAPLLPENIRFVLEYFMSRAFKYYDYTGLFFWLLYKTCEWFGFLDDPDADFCSESIYDGFTKGELLIADCDNPSPDDIENYAKERILFSNLTC